jgi:hypothetical protein
VQLLEAHFAAQLSKPGERLQRLFHRRRIEVAVIRHAAAKRRHHLFVE